MKVEKNSEFEIQSRGGQEYAHRVSDKSYLFRVSKSEHENDYDLLRFAYNSGFAAGMRHQENFDASLVEELALEIRRPR